MGVILGTGEFTYRVCEDWAQLPAGWAFGDVAAVGIDARDRVYVFNRSEHPMIVFERDGSFVTSWGEDTFTHAHGVHMGPDDTIYCTDDFDHTVRKCTLDGKVLLEIGIPHEPSPFMSGKPFNRCTHTALSPRGDIYVTDGYSNACVHKYSPDGKLLMSWGTSGIGPGEFNLPHNVTCDEDGWVYVADRENHRIQVFDGNGRYETEWHNLHRPNGMYMPGGKCPICYVGEIGPYFEFNRGAPNLGPRISVVSNDGTILARLGRDPMAGNEPGKLLSPHGLAVDSHGDLYVGQVAVTAWPSLFPDKPLPKVLRSIEKFEKVPAGTTA
ncbi:peptidyl-alpha-hydroxyglycine alpha-amidating lyase family protein [Microbaculum marinum]|uniref:Peptidyl-alpha-hydroxyglycine alpha-amidating lyase family protein n=1 Tax=Microbaculum marinum TaxID=1764581 RepID=A0AAW9RTE3_9HYPH